MIIRRGNQSQEDFEVMISIGHVLTFNQMLGLGCGVVEHNSAHNRTVEGHIMIALQEMHTWHSILIFFDSIVKMSYDGPIAVVEFNHFSGASVV
jgi:hypothetical protein